MPIKKIKLSYIGKPQERESTKGKWQSVGIKIEGFDGWINGSFNEMVAKWKVGDELELEIDKKEYKGKTYYNFKAPSAKVTRAEFDLLVERISKIEKRLGLDKIEISENQEFPAY